MQLHRQSKLVFIGDSVTDCGRSPDGEGLFGALGTGYVQTFDAWVGASRPEMRLRVVNKGTSGHTSRDLLARWHADVVDLKPDAVAMMIGINDVWRQFDSPLRPEIHVGPEEYRSNLVAMASHAPCPMLLATPFFIEPLRADAMRARMDAYGALVRSVAQEVGAEFLDTQAAFDAVLVHTPSASIAWDRVHPNAIGHTVLARAFLGAFGLL